MSYYVWQSDSSLSRKFLHASIEPKSLEHDEWITGKHISKPATMTLVGDNDSPETLSDMILTGFRLPILSPKAIEVLKNLGVKNLEYFPVNIKHKKMKGVVKTYQIANVIGLVNCLDKEHSKFTTFVSDPSEISYLKEYKILEAKVKNAPLIFRLGEFRYHLLAHESVKKAWEKEGLTGAQFVPTEKFA